MSSKRSPRRSRWARAVISTLAVLNTLCAAVGALGLATGFLDLGDDLNERLPWSSPVVGGVALALIVGLPNGLLSVLSLRHDRHAPMTAIVVGAAMVLWIAVELAYLRQVNFLHPIYLAVGILMIATGAWLTGVELGVAPTHFGRRATRRSG